MRFVISLLALLIASAAAHANDKVESPAVFGRAIDPGLAAPAANDALVFDGSRWTHGQPWSSSGPGQPFLRLSSYAVSGAPDQTAQVQAWINACQSANVICYADPGSYNFTTVSVTGACVRIVGGGEYAVVFNELSAAANGFVINCGGRPEFSNFQMIAPIGHQGTCFYFAAAGVPRLTHISGVNCGTGIFTNGAPYGSAPISNFTWDDLDFGACNNFCLDIRSPGDSTITHSKFNAIPSAAAVIHAMWNAGLRFSDNKVTGATRGLWWVCPLDSDILVTANSFEGQTATGFEVDGGGCNQQFNNVMVTGNELAGMATAISFPDAAFVGLAHITAAGNVLNCAAGGSGFRMAAGDSPVVGGNSIYGCAAPLNIAPGVTNVHTY